METPELPPIQGIKQMSPLEMNTVHFEKRHTVLTPQVLESMANNPKAKMKPQ